MECKCPLHAITKILQEASDIITDRNFLNIYSHAVLKIDGDILSIYASDSIIHTYNSMHVEGIENGTTAIHAARMLSVLKSITESVVHLRFENNAMIIKGIGAKQTQARFELKTIEASEFQTVPELTDGLSIEIRTQTLLALISKSIISVLTDDTRVFLTGVYFTQENGILHIVATDGKRLSIVKDPTIQIPSDFTGKILPVKMLKFIQKHGNTDDIATLTVYDRFFSVVIGDGLRIIAPHIEGQFPDYKRVIPETQTNHIRIDRQECIQALKKASLFAELSKKVLFHIQSNKIHIHANDNNFGKAEEYISTEYSGEDVLFGFNHKYLLDPLLVEESKNVKISFTDPQKVVTITPDEEQTMQSYHIIMPMKVHL